ncbi:hypothetical protein J5N97_010000 [Dioscorea zingiberensis]|uniref:non-specific serine/threonine protein kinase n=1 Tax=Dioscorea zingiberensis TaxID=325984 RepID=A0A9D5D0J5_9LILI|nr:hypothetical protein J5N97_010000 [Dioscorea zingiberensis]
MQLLQAINCFLQTCNDTCRRSLAIRYYSVTPISGRAGLIQWVENVTSIYSVFKSWQNRAQLVQLSALGTGNVRGTVPPVPRPSDMFYGKIIPALKEKGLRRVISRRDWPHEVKRKVLLELMQETPRQLLWQEMWCASEGFKAFNLKAKRFSASVAAMSMVGHILGLGDRHLDNILIDFLSGDVVHIDYNVCFDKGKRLKIPEIVPFRLTQIIEAALGLTGTEGSFRSNCQSVTGVLRKNKDIILMMLEVFVWDPLVEWTRGDGHDEAVIGGEEKKGMELAVSLSLFASRVQEIRVPLQQQNLHSRYSGFARLSSLEDAFSLKSAVLVSGIPLTVVPEPTLAQCSEIDGEVSRLVAELHTGLSSAVEALHEYTLALQRVLPLNYITSTQVNGWAQLLQLLVSNLSSDTLSLAKRQAADLVAKVKGDVSDSVKQRHQDLFHKMETYTMEIDKVNVECSGLMNSIGTDTEVKSKEKLLSAFTKYMQASGYSRSEVDSSVNREGQQKYDVTKDFNVHGDLEDRKSKVLSVVQIAANELFKIVKGKLLNFLNNPSGKVTWISEDDFVQHDSVTYHEFEEQIEKCALVSGFVNEVWDLFGFDTSTGNGQFISEGNWPSLFQACLYSCKKLIEQITEISLPDIIRSVISYNSEVMEAFGSISQIRGAIDTALEKLFDVELERTSLVELEKNYFVKVGLITEQQLALEEAAVKGRDHLSWEEAEELASQEEACRAKLDKLHQTWNEKDARSSSLKKLETDIKNSLVSTGRYFSTLISSEQGDGSAQNVAEIMASGTPPSGLTWRYLKRRLAPALIMQLDKQNENLEHIIKTRKETDKLKQDVASVKRVHFMLEEYCNAHETARAAKSAILLMKRKVLAQSILGDDKFYPAILNLSRPKLLEKFQSSISTLSNLMDCLQACERTSVSVEGQLERAMGWACASPSVAGAEQDWKLAKNNMEVAANSFFSATRELTIASRKGKICFWSDLRIFCLYCLVISKINLIFEGSEVPISCDIISICFRVSRGHTALTSECGSMLEEVLAITRSLHDLYSLGKQAAAAHSVLMADLGKANAILIPLEASLSTDVVALADGISKDKENNSDIPPIHGQALYKSYYFRLREACQPLEHLVPSIICSVKELHSMLTKLGRASGLHAGNLHKALEGVGESQLVRSQELALSRSDFSAGANLLDDKDKNFLEGDGGNFQGITESSPEGEGWISPPEHTYISSLDSSIASSEASAAKHSDNAVADNSMHVSHTSTCWQENETLENSVSQFAAEDDITIAATSVPPDLGESSQVLTSSKSTDISSTSSDNIAPADPHKMRPVPSSLNDVVSSIEHWYNVEKEASRDDKPLSCRNRQYSSKKVVEGHWGNDDNPSCKNSANCVTREMNTYALSVLRQIELKLEGRENDEFRSMTISEQVDHLLRQATSIDNLCNMYEGWTPWI